MKELYTNCINTSTLIFYYFMVWNPQGDFRQENAALRLPVVLCTVGILAAIAPSLASLRFVAFRFYPLSFGASTILPTPYRVHLTREFIGYSVVGTSIRFNASWLHFLSTLHADTQFKFRGFHFRLLISPLLTLLIYSCPLGMSIPIFDLFNYFPGRLWHDLRSADCVLVSSTPALSSEYVHT
jgi:hypothetical protein